ncbi:MAG: tRNA uridine(34) 5-carboxymethylaminomethyl modification radical SAM/GNAT enzyme Elp3, partial [Nitrososphaerota archaeon]|nr:tRNA uridine(34) 5-carboxymethylaminomethyl modification radical SAM/GNAT enzyme Elp3 [Nitrososphaerota archaeon]
MDSNKTAIREVIDTLLNMQAPTHEDVNRLKIKIAAKHHLSTMISNADLIAALTPTETTQLLPILRRKTTRTISGVTVVATMTEPYPCPQPEPCAYCPGGPTQGSPQSYTGHEPAAMRGSQNNFDPYMQVQSRIQQLTAIGHKVDKIELIIMGGTFPATPIDYQTHFIQKCLDAITNKNSTNLEEAKTYAEISKIRNVGITVESRPDWAKQPHIDTMLNMGVTRIELGVQNPCDNIYQIVGRTHTVADVIEATQIAKDAGLKIVYHMMPGMPGSNPQKDIKAFQEIFTNPQFKPDMIKIYPCLAI